MRAPYTCLYREIWDDERFWSMSEIGKLIYFYVLSTPMGNGLGCFRAGLAAMIEEARLLPERFLEGFQEGLAKGLFHYDEHSRVLLIPKYFGRNPPSNPNGIKALSKEYVRIPDCKLKRECFLIVAEFVAKKSEPFKEPFNEGFKEPLLEPPGRGRGRGRGKESPSPSCKELALLATPGGDLNSRNRSGDPLPLAVSSLTSETKPKRTNKTKKKSPAKGGPTWEAYSAGYLQRYGVEPKRNQKVNSLCCQLVDRLGAEEAPLVAGYYPTTQNGYYVQRGHILDCLVADAEKVRTEWATGKAIYQRQAREQDRLGATGELWREIMAENEIKEREKQNAK